MRLLLLLEHLIVDTATDVAYFELVAGALAGQHVEVGSAGGAVCLGYLLSFIEKVGKRVLLPAGLRLHRLKRVAGR